MHHLRRACFSIASGAASLLVSAVMANAQGRGAPDWAAAGFDAQRSSWVRSDPKISSESMAKPGFQLMWKVKLSNNSRGPNSLTAPVLTDRYIGYRGFRSYAFIGGSGDNVFAFDSDLGRIEWQKHFPTKTTPSTACPGGMTAPVARSITAAYPSTLGRGGFGGRGGPARSGVGAASEGAVTLAPANPPAGFPAAGRGPARGPARTPAFLSVLSGDGAFHSMYISNGDEPQPPVKFLEPGANATDLIVVDEIPYAVTSNGCAGVADGLWALDPATKTVAGWKAKIAGSSGPAFGPDGTIFVAAADGDLTSLEPKTLVKKMSFQAGKPFSSSPVVFEMKGRNIVAAGLNDGSVVFLDPASLTKIAASSASGAPVEWLSAWQDPLGARWLVAATAKAISALRIRDAGAALSAETAWTSQPIASAAPPLVMNGVVFAVSGANANSHAVLYAFDGTTGKELWNSGNTIPSFLPRGGGIAAGGSAVYLATHDGTFWAFGFPIEH